MDDLKGKILARVRGRGRGVVYVSKDFLDLGNRAAVDQALSRLVKAGRDPPPRPGPLRLPAHQPPPRRRAEPRPGAGGGGRRAETRRKNFPIGGPRCKRSRSLDADTGEDGLRDRRLSWERQGRAVKRSPSSG